MTKQNKDSIKDILKSEHYSKIIFYLNEKPTNPLNLSKLFSEIEGIKKSSSIISRQCNELIKLNFLKKTELGEIYYVKNSREVNYNKIIEKFFQFFIDRRLIDIKEKCKRVKIESFEYFKFLRPINQFHSIDEILSKKFTEKNYDFKTPPQSLDEALNFLRDEYLDFFKNYKENFYLEAIFKILIKEGRRLRLETIYDLFLEIEFLFSNLDIFKFLKDYEINISKPFNLDNRLGKVQELFLVMKLISTFNNINMYQIAGEFSDIIKRELIFRDKDIIELIKEKENVMKMIKEFEKIKQKEANN